MVTDGPTVVPPHKRIFGRLFRVNRIARRSFATESIDRLLQRREGSPVEATGGMDPASDAAEAQHFRRILASFDQYRRSRPSLASLPRSLTSRSRWQMGSRGQPTPSKGLLSTAVASPDLVGEELRREVGRGRRPCQEERRRRGRDRRTSRRDGVRVWCVDNLGARSGADWCLGDEVGEVEVRQQEAEKVRSSIRQMVRDWSLAVRLLAFLSIS